MGSEIVQHNNRAITIKFPDSVTDAIVRRAIVRTVVGVVRTVSEIGAGLHTAVVEVDRQRQVQVDYYNRYSQVLRSDIIPYLALANAHQDGRRAVASAGLDDDLHEDALADMERARQRRRDQLHRRNL